MSIAKSNPNLPQDFQNCDDRVFAFAPDKLPHKDKPIHAIRFDRLEYAIKIKLSLFDSKKYGSGLNLLGTILNRMRKFKIGKHLYVYAYEARWDSNYQLDQELGFIKKTDEPQPIEYQRSNQLKACWHQAKKYGLLHNSAKQGQTNRLLRLHDDLIELAQMTDEELWNWKLCQISLGASSTNLLGPSKANNNKVSQKVLGATNTNPDGATGTNPDGATGTNPDGATGTIELNNELNKKLNNIVKRTADPSNRLVEQSDQEQNNMTTNDAVIEIKADQSSSSFRCPDVLNKRVKKRQVLKAWRDVFYERIKDDNKSQAVFSYIGDRFFVGLYNNLSNWLGEQGIHNGKVNMIEQMALVVFDQVIFTPGLYKDEFANRCKIKKGHTFLDHQFFQEIRHQAFKSLDESQKHALEPATAQAISLDQKIAERATAMKLAGNSDDFLKVIKKLFFENRDVKHLDQETKDCILLDIVNNDASWNQIINAYNNDNLETIMRPFFFEAILKKSETFIGQKKNVGKRQRFISEKDQWAHGLIAQSQKTMNRKRPTQWIS